MDGAPKGNYDVELVMSQYKSCSVFKRYYVPLLTKLPAELKVRCYSSFAVVVVVCFFFLGGGGVCGGGDPYMKRSLTNMLLEIVIIPGITVLLLCHCLGVLRV